MSGPQQEQKSAEEVNRTLLVENEKKIRLGLLLVKLGVASNEEVFPDGLKRKPRLRATKQEKPVKSGGFFSWFTGSGKKSSTGGQQAGGVVPPIPPRKERVTQQGMPTPNEQPAAPKVDPVAVAQAEAKEKAEEEAQRRHDEAHKLAQQQQAEAAAAAAAAAAKKKNPKASMRPLSDAEAEALPAEVAYKRKGLYESEEVIHKMLTSVEETRYKYLVPSPNPICDPEIDAVTKCYEKSNAVFDSRLNAGKMKMGDIHDDVLKCGDVVAALKKCAMNGAKEYILSDE